MGIVTIGDIFPNLSNAIKLVCHSCDNQNSFSKLKLSNDKKTLVGVMFIGKSQIIENDCFFVKSRLYKSVLKYKIFSIQIENESQREMITREFNKWFNQFTSSINIQFKTFNKERNEQQPISCCFPKKQKSKNVCIANAPRIPDALELSKMSKSESTKHLRDIQREALTRWHGADLSRLGVPTDSIYSSESSLGEPVSPISTQSVKVGASYSRSPSPNTITPEKEQRDALYYHPNQIMRKKVSNSRLSVQSPLQYEHQLALCEKYERKLIESELIENKTNTLSKFDMCQNLIQDQGKKSKQEKKQMNKLIKELDNTNCKSYMLRVPKPLLAIKGPETPSPIESKNNIVAKITEV